MSMDTVRREIAAKRAYATKLEERLNDEAHVFNEPSHRGHLRAEVERLWAEADRQEAQLATPRHPRH